MAYIVSFHKRMEGYSFLRLLRISGADQLGALHVAALFGA